MKLNSDNSPEDPPPPTPFVIFSQTFEKMIQTRPPPTFLHDVTKYAVVFFKAPLTGYTHTDTHATFYIRIILLRKGRPTFDRELLPPLRGVWCGASADQICNK